MSNSLIDSQSFLQPLIVVTQEANIANVSDLSHILHADRDDLEFTIISAEKTATVSVDQIRDILLETSKKNITNKIRVFVLTQAGKMKDVAQNSMLKLLEEPSVGVQIILMVNDSNDLLPTLLSRCRIVRLKKDYAENINVLDESFLINKITQSKADKAKKTESPKLVWKDKNLRPDMLELQCLSGKLSDVIDEQKIAKLWLFNLWTKNN